MIPFLTILRRIFFFVMEALTGWWRRTDNDSSPARISKRLSFYRPGQEHERREGRKELRALLDKREGELKGMREQGLLWQRRALDAEKRLAEESSARRVEEDGRRKAEEHIRELRKRIDSREGELKASNAAKAELEKALAHGQVERRNLTALLETKTAELKEAQTYMSKVDDVSDSEVLQLAKNINAAIFQIAAKVADDCHSTIDATASRPLRDQAAARLEKAVNFGSDLPRILAGADHTQDNILVQIALQALFAISLRNLASAWPTPVDERISLLQSIYGEMCRQGVSSRPVCSASTDTVIRASICLRKVEDHDAHLHAHGTPRTEQG